ncbi:nicotinate-nucleotide adenylyltransferase [Chloroflexota bacterium]
MNIGILGGTFDPPHNGHIAVAEEARKRLGLEEVLFVPAGQTPLKEGVPIQSAEHRVQMVRQAIAEYPYFKLSTVEIDRDGLSFTVDTIDELKDMLGSEAELFFILGWDNLEQLPRWKEPLRMINACHLVAVRRPGYFSPDLDVLEEAIPGIKQRVIVLDKPETDVSATEIRDLVARGMPVHHLVPAAVATYIEKNKLYL